MPIALLANGTVREARGFAQDELSVGQRELDVDEADDPERGASQPPSPRSPRRCPVERGRRQDARRVARVHARLLDALHDSRDVGLPTVAQRVDVDLDHTEEAVDEHALPLAAACATASGS